MTFAQGSSNPFDLLRLPEPIVKFFGLRIEDPDCNVGKFQNPNNSMIENFSLTATNGGGEVIHHPYSSTEQQPSGSPCWLSRFYFSTLME